MDELLTWLQAQGSGLTMHSDFRKRARALAEKSPDKAAFLHLLVAMSRRFASFFDDVPLPRLAAEEARRKLIDLLERGAAMTADSPRDYLDFLNAVATENLLIGRP